MTEHEFQTHMSRLIEQFGKPAYSQSRVQLIWREVQDMHSSWFSGVVNRFVGDFRQAPLVQDFRDECVRDRERSGGNRSKVIPFSNVNQIASCGTCNDHGVYLCTRRDPREGLFAFRCHCYKGNQDPRRSIPQYKAEHASEYFYFDMLEHKRAQALAHASGRRSDVSTST